MIERYVYFSLFLFLKDEKPLAHQRLIITGGNEHKIETPSLY